MRYHPSLLILKGRPKRRRFRPRKRSLNDRVRDERLEALEWALDRVMRERSALITEYTRRNAEGYRVVTIEQHYREQATQIELNRAEIAGIKAREVPIMNREKKEIALKLLYGFLEEAHDLREEQRLQRLDIDALKSRAVGDASE